MAADHEDGIKAELYLPYPPCDPEDVKLVLTMVGGPEDGLSRTVDLGPGQSIALMAAIAAAIAGIDITRGAFG